ncbi:peptide ABC transporter substrate-binding protein [Mobilitalea sibirica]|uniref:Peptide ABC transporter substrate-binding protein n=1 Tax=Mobilitalea sibirica TaxID=1462919 RepID=A0A8J7KUT2_9FIRM|nr:peptide ABC transporter substrate-binding protein [Mobilitalea sibirica]MBH1939355.1 peptide ABC transporter substrate-binding protein [Mobilitalea sibirica]
MKFKKLLSVILVLAMSVMLLAGCGTKDKGKEDDTNNTTPEPTATEAPVEDTNVDEALQESDRSAYPGTPEANAITVNIASEPPEMFSVTMTDTTSFSVLRHIVENLVMLDKDDRVVPGVAETWTQSDDGLVYTFKLREGMKWSNGEPVTANDFVFAWKSLLTPEFASDYAYFAYIFKNGEAFNKGEVGAEELGFKALSDYELEVTLEHPAPYFLSTLAFGVFAPVNEKAYNEFGTAYGTDADKMVYNGPFKMTSWEHESKIVLEKNPDFYNASEIALDKITMVMINDSNAALNSFKAGEVDVIGVTGDQAMMMKGENYPVITYDDGSSWYLEFNLAEPALANKNLRKAITYAIDSPSFTANIVKNNSKPATGFTPPAMNGLEKKFTEEVGELIPAFDPEQAKELYATALQELGVDKVELTMISGDSDVAVQYAAYVQEQLKVNLGLEIEVEIMTFKSRLERMSNKDFSIVYAGWGPDYNDPMTFLDMFETGGGNNHSSYSSEAYDELLDKVRAELDPAVRMGYLYELEKLLCEDLPIAPIYWRSRDYIVSGKIAGGVIRTAFQDMNYRYVKLAQ